jgi:glycosidase
VDGFRIDTLRYLKGELPRRFGDAIREFALSIGKKNFFMFGGRYSKVEGVDAVLDFLLFDTLKAVIKGFAPPIALAKVLERRIDVRRDTLDSHSDVSRSFVTFLENHDDKERLRFVQRGDEHRFDDEVTLGVACLFSLPGIPYLYYGVEQGLHGSGSDAGVREALWGSPGFNEQSHFFREIAKISRIRSDQPALRYGRCYFRPVSGDGKYYDVSPFPQGIISFSRILHDQEIVVVANTNRACAQSLNVAIDTELNRPNTSYDIIYSNKPKPVAPGRVEIKQAGSVLIKEVNGSCGHGPILSFRFTLQPLEIQILGK